jgi:hypothetical protein
MQNQKQVLGEVLVAHACNPSYMGDRDWKIKVQGQPEQKA